MAGASESSSVTALSAQQQDAVNGGFNNKEDDEKEITGEPRTGWNHNQPSSSSDFWIQKSASTASGSSSTTDNQHTNTEEEGELRTGWLHNKESRAKQQEREKAEAAAATGSTSSTTTPSGTTNVARRRLELAKEESLRNHRIVSPPIFYNTGGARDASGRIRMVTEHVISVPLLRSSDEPSTTDSSGRLPTTTANEQRLDLYFTVVETVDAADKRREWEKLLGAGTSNERQRAERYVRMSQLSSASTLALYLQGGPGFGSPTPGSSIGIGTDASWISAALDDNANGLTHVVLMDQRGTGKSSPITKQTLQLQFPDLFLLDRQQQQQQESPLTLAELVSSNPEEGERFQVAVQDVTNYMSQFRANSIVKDAEDIRDALMTPPDPEDDKPRGPRPWGCCLGQSFGGFCLLSYLSLVEHPPQVCLFTGGIAPIMCTSLHGLYSSLWDRVHQRNRLYYEQFPGDIVRVKRIVQKLLEEPPVLPSGGKLTARRFLQLGMRLGSSPNSFATLHSIITSAFVDTATTTDPIFRRSFVKLMDSEQSFDDAPIYFWLHESIYANGPSQNSPTNWAALRAYQDKVSGNGDCWDYRVTSAAIDDMSKPVLFFGEMVFPWMAEDYAELGGIGLTAVAEKIAAKTDWDTLWDNHRIQQALEPISGTSRAAAAIYYEDMYVDFDATMDAVRRGPLSNCRQWVTNEYQHSGLRDDGAYIFAKLYGMATGTIRTPS